MNNNPKNNILMSENIRQKRPTILEYFDAYIYHLIQYSRIVSLFCLIFSDMKMLFFGLSFILYVLQLSGKNGFYKNTQ